MIKPDRKVILLRAAFDMLRKCEDSPFVVSPMETVVFYDDADCDGSCLMGVLFIWRSLGGRFLP